MAYDVTTVTIKGTELLAAATAANNLVLAGCDATQTFISKADAVYASERPDNPVSTTTNVRLEGSSDGHVFIRIFFVAGESTGGDVNSLYLYGHSANDSVDWVLAVMSSQTPFHLPEEGDISNTYGTLLDIVYNVADGSVSSVTTSVYATYSEYANIRDRAVTTHAQYNDSVGENQTILGNKTFNGTIGTKKSIEFYGPEMLPLIKTGEPGFVSDTTCATQYGSRTPIYIPVNIFDGTGLSNKTFYNSSLNFTTTDAAHISSSSSTSTQDIHELKMSADNLSAQDNGVTRYLAIQSSTRINNSTYWMSSVRTHVDRMISQEPAGGGAYTQVENETGRVELIARERLHGKSAHIQLSTQYIGNDTINPKSSIGASADDLCFDGSSAVINAYSIKLNSVNESEQGFEVQLGNSNLSVLVYDSGDVGTFTIGVDNNALTLYGIGGSIGMQEVNLGTANYPFNHIYATTVHGTVSNAANDANGNAITSYVKSVAPIALTETSFGVVNGSGTTVQTIDLNSLTSLVVRGKNSSSDSVFNSVGAIGMFLYTGAVATKGPGDTVSGSDLKPASLMKEYSSGEFKIISHPTTSASGTWALLSYFSTSSTGDAPLVLAVKISLT